MEKLMKSNNETKEENTTINIKSHTSHDSYDIQMMEAVNRDSQVFNSLHPVRQADLTHNLQKTYGNQYVQRLIKLQSKNEKPLQSKKEKTNNLVKAKNETRLPDSLKENVENLSGLSLDDVQVHYNSNEPKKLDALAYTQGNDIYVSFGQEKHLPHEAWHVVQQKQGRVQPNIQCNGVNISDDEELEREADIIGEKSIQMVSKSNDINESFENMFGLSLEDMVVHRNSYKSKMLPTQAYTQGNGVNIAHRQEKLLGNEFAHMIHHRGLNTDTQQVKWIQRQSEKRQEELKGECGVINTGIGISTAISYSQLKEPPSSQGKNPVKGQSDKGSPKRQSDKGSPKRQKPKIFKEIKVKLDEQMVETFDNGKMVHRFKCVTGAEDSPTDKGTFRIFSKQHPYTSKKYKVKMDYAMFFTHDGKALHQYHGLFPVSMIRFGKQHLNNRLGSHGCVRLSEENAKELFDWTPISTKVNVV